MVVRRSDTKVLRFQIAKPLSARIGAKGAKAKERKLQVTKGQKQNRDKGPEAPQRAGQAKAPQEKERETELDTYSQEDFRSQEETSSWRDHHPCYGSLPGSKFPGGLERGRKKGAGGKSGRAAASSLRGHRPAPKASNWRRDMEGASGFDPTKGDHGDGDDDEPQEEDDPMEVGTWYPP